MKILQNKWNGFFIACLAWLVTVFVVVIAVQLTHPMRSSYEGGFYNCIQLNVDGYYECSYFDYVLNVIFVQTIGWIFGFFVMPRYFFALVAFYPETEGTWYINFIYFLAMPYIFVPITYGLLRWLNRYLVRSGSPPSRG
jgi:hypothetical protein